MPEKSQGQAIPSVDEYIGALRAIQGDITKNQREMLRIHYSAPDHQITATELADGVGYKNFRGVNLQYGRLAYLLCQVLNRSFPYYVSILATFISPAENPSGEWLLVMRPEVVQALERLKWVTPDPGTG